MIYMKNKLFYVKIIVVLLCVFSAICNSKFYDSKLVEYTYLESYSNYFLVEKNIVNKSIVSYLYKDNENNYIDKVYDYNTLEEINLDSILKKDKLDDYNKKIEELIYLKYPKFISRELVKDTTKKSYIFRSNELVIYFNNYKIEPEIKELLYLKVNYNEIKDYLEFVVTLDSNYENESGYNYNNSKKSVAITFDDSPNYNKTNKILNSLKDNHFHATFFVVGEKAIYNKDLLISIKNSGNEIGSHTYSHQNLNKLTDEEILEDFNIMNNIYKNLFNEDLKLIRPPYGLIKESQTKLMKASYIMWSLDTNDWRYRSSDYLVNYVLNNIKDGDIILFHDSYNSTVNAVNELLPLLYSKGYQVMSISELFELKGIKLEDYKVYDNLY